jgi:alpha-beta hydrolase superfamily lysophospholipase
MMAREEDAAMHRALVSMSLLAVAATSALPLAVTAASDRAAPADPAAPPRAERPVYDRSALDAVDYGGLPAPTRVAARDGAFLAVRAYPSAASVVVVAIHGSSGDGRYYHPLARALSARGVATVYTVDLRGHGASDGRRGDVDYIGQLEDDVADVMTAVRRAHPRARLALLGHSAGGGLIVRGGGGGRMPAADAYVLLAPMLGHDAPTTKPAFGGWTVVDRPKVLEIATRSATGDATGQDAVVLRFAQPASQAAPGQVLAYTYRMMMSFAPGRDLAAQLAGLRAPLLLLAGDRDESFHADRYAAAMAPHARATVRVLPGVSHLELVVTPRTATAIEAWLATLP